MANPGRSSDSAYPDGRYPDAQSPDEQYPAAPGRARGDQPYPPAAPTGTRAPGRPGSPQQEPWAGAPWAPPSAPTPAGGPSASQAGRREDDPWQASVSPSPGRQLPPPEWADSPMAHRWTTSWRIRATAAQPALPEAPPAAPAGTRPARDTGAWAFRSTGAQPTATGANPALPGPARPGIAAPTRAQAVADGGTRITGAMRTTGAMPTTGAMRAAGTTRTTGSMRTVKPMAPGTGRARIVAPIVVLAVIALGFVGVAYLWWLNTLFLHTPGAILVDIGEILGLIAGYGIVILVALMARLPPLERGIGTDRLARWHATGGRWIISTVTGHVAFMILGYAYTSHSSVTSETALLITTFPDILMATVAWGLLLGVAAFSMRAARRRMSYETWYHAHLYTYLAIALAFSHQFADGGTFALSFTARAAWTTLYVVVGGLLLWYRVITPLLNARQHQFTVQSVRPEAAGIVSVFITGREFDRLRAEPGQFFRWRFLTPEHWWQSHPYSLSAMPQPDLIRITVKARGDHSGSLAHLKPGTRIIAEGPYGAFTPSLTGRRLLFIAGGVGITPIRAMFAALPKRMSGGITLLYRASHPRDVVFSRELNAIANDRQAALHYLIGSRAELGYDPLDAQHLQQTVPGLHRYEAYVCGPSGMTEAAVRSLVAAGIPRRRIHHENFDF
jgi:ferredoxin-NADP reductase/DMSO/TMAO reductase YedYZ heme-binding membrane subunit